MRMCDTCDKRGSCIDYELTRNTSAIRVFVCAKYVPDAEELERERYREAYEEKMSMNFPKEDERI